MLDEVTNNVDEKDESIMDDEDELLSNITVLEAMKIELNNRVSKEGPEPARGFVGLASEEFYVLSCAIEDAKLVVQQHQYLEEAQELIENIIDMCTATQPIHYVIELRLWFPKAKIWLKKYSKEYSSE